MAKRKRVDWMIDRDIIKKIKMEAIKVDKRFSHVAEEWLIKGKRRN